MIKTITRIGNSKGIIFDAALLELAHLKEGDRVNVTVHEGGTIVLTPEAPGIDDAAFDAATDEVLSDYAETLKKLS